MLGLYKLPCYLTVLCEDRFSILDSDELEVPFWAVFEKLLVMEIGSVGGLIDLLETIAIIRHGKTLSDYGLLKHFLAEKETLFFKQTWPVLVDIALQMPSLFPDRSIPTLRQPDQNRLTLSRKQVACLVVHQFLCTLAGPVWQNGFQDFHIWYSEEQPHEKVVRAYLVALFEYFERLRVRYHSNSSRTGAEEPSIFYTLYTDQKSDLPRGTKLQPLETVRLKEPTTSPDLLGLPNGASVISANRFIGFGRTGTQEETHVGASPECCPAVLITPPLQDGEVVVVVGAEPMVTIAGYGRDARCEEVLREEATAQKWSQRTMLFMDALELDLQSRDKGLPDLGPGNVEREFRKAYLAFSSRPEDPYAAIYTGYWGCRTFGGNPGIKTLIQWCAASLAGCPMRFVCSGEEQIAFGWQLEEFIRQLTDHGRNGTDDVLDALRQLTPQDLGSGDPLVYLQGQLCQ